MEVNEANIRSILQLFGSSQSHISEKRKPAVEKIGELNTCDGFMSCLLVILRNKSIAFNLRLGAAIQFKNISQRYWVGRRRLGGKSVSEREKTILMKEVLSHLSFSEESDPIFAQIALSVASIARKEWPKRWKTLFPVMLEVIQKGNKLQVTRSLHMLHQVLQELVSRRMLVARKAFEKSAAPLLEFMTTAWARNQLRQFNYCLPARSGLLTNSIIRHIVGVLLK